MPQGCHLCHWGRQTLCRWMKRCVSTQMGHYVQLRGESVREANEPIFQAAPPCVPPSTPLYRPLETAPRPFCTALETAGATDAVRRSLSRQQTQLHACLWLCNKTKVPVRRADEHVSL